MEKATIIKIKNYEADDDMENSLESSRESLVGANLVFEIASTKKKEDLQIKVKKLKAESRILELKLKDEAQFGKTYGLYRSD